MLTLLIVDDDIDIVSGLSETIPWTQCGIENVLKAYSGEEAMEIISETHVDIMVTDIKMPGIDGIELLERVTEKMIAPKTIILSGYAEFEYAQSALGLGAIGYVLKPVKVQELMDLVGRTVDSLLFQRKYTEDLHQTNHYEYVVTTKVLTDLLLNPDAVRNPVFKEKIVRLEREYPGSKSMAVLQLRDVEMRETIDYRKICADLRRCVGKCLLLGVDYGTIVLIVTGKKSISEWKKILSEEVIEIECYYGGSIKIGIHEKVESWVKLSDRYKETLKTMELGFFLNEQRFFSVQEEKYPEKDGNESQIIQKIETIDVCIEFEKIDELIKVLENSRKFYVFQIQKIFRAILKQMQEYCVQNFIFMEVEEDYKKALKVVGAAPAYKQAADSLYFFYERIQSIKSQEIMSVKERLISVMKNYVEEHYSEDINIVVLAEKTGRSSNYLSHLFSEINGMTFSEFLNRMRIGKAKEKLIQTDDTIYTISKDVGYNDERYFVKIFKKYVNMTPSQYRNSRK